MDIQRINRSHVGKLVEIRGEFLARGSDKCDCWLAPMGEMEIDNSWILLGEKAFYEYVCAQLEPIGGGKFLYAKPCIATGIITMRNNQLTMRVKKLEFEEDNEVHSISMPNKLTDRKSSG